MMEVSNSNQKLHSNQMLAFFLHDSHAIFDDNVPIDFAFDVTQKSKTKKKSKEKKNRNFPDLDRYDSCNPFLIHR